MFLTKGKLLTALCAYIGISLSMAQVQSEETEAIVKPSLPVDLSKFSATGKSFKSSPEIYAVQTDFRRSVGDNTETGTVYTPKPIDLPSPGKSFKSSPEIYATQSDPRGSVGDNTGTGTVFIAKPIDGSVRSGPSISLGNVGENLDAAYSKWRNSVGDGSVDFQKRISVGHYGGGVPSHGHAQSGTNFQSHHHPYPYEYTHSSTGGVAEGATGAYYGSSSAETGIPFDVYGSRPAHGHYAAHGAEYSYLPYQYDIESHEIASHKSPSEVAKKTLLAKSFLIPLASAAVLGIAAALVSNPLLLQLGTVSGVGVAGGLTPAIVGKRKKRAIRRAYFSQI